MRGRIVGELMDPRMIAVMVTALFCLALCAVVPFMLSHIELLADDACCGRNVLDKASIVFSSCSALVLLGICIYGVYFYRQLRGRRSFGASVAGSFHFSMRFSH